MTPEEMLIVSKVIAPAIDLVDQWRQRIANNQSFEIRLWEAIDKYQDKTTIDIKWIRSIIKQRKD